MTVVIKALYSPAKELEAVRLEGKRKFVINEEAANKGDYVFDGGIAQNVKPEERRLAMSKKDIVLYVKAGPDGESLGDCPFAHFIQMCLQRKRLAYDLRPCTAATKPSWLADHYEGKMPCLVHKGEAYTESSVVAEYLDFFFPDVPLVPEGGEDAYRDADEAAAQLFPAAARYIKGADAGARGADAAHLRTALGELEAFLGGGGPRAGPRPAGRAWLHADAPGRADYALAPKLYHLQTCLGAFEDCDAGLLGDFPRTQEYMAAAFALDEFQKTSYPPEVVVWGWANAREAARSSPPPPAAAEEEGGGEEGAGEEEAREEEE
eukprot:CAMPEP_0206389054 /NCGR_PEP_ID=MMETSP0294-20121207/17678_1 /ASSEMBLY_ACC=CAM_ASM_000327 /TAXON_ID=39354 /ORGANISM="Heterosigma akashiwo, Strain CCMP2393" /LENGTH=320 /DNA_ID=CAMNT_0053840955 /DNA_START=67 /DNA_END=1028 /DNA_ORIENTATION=+